MPAERIWIECRPAFTSPWSSGFAIRRPWTSKISIRAGVSTGRSKRMVAERCIYGVDVNEMAVELAKLSMWLFTMDRGRPLSFLDHHLKCGNSLLGAPLDKLGEPPANKPQCKI